MKNIITNCYYIKILQLPLNINKIYNNYFKNLNLYFSLIIFLIISFSNFAQSLETLQYFQEVQSLEGPTGNIYTFSPNILNKNNLSFGLHRFTVGINYGLIENLEIGIIFDLQNMGPIFPLNQENIEKKKEEISFHSKFRILDSSKGDPISFSIGQRRDLIYLVGEKYFPYFWDISIQCGVSWKINYVYPFFAFTRTQSFEQLIIDYETRNDQYNFGLRFLVSPEMKLDFFLKDFTRIKNIFFDNFVFGLTLVV